MENKLIISKQNERILTSWLEDGRIRQFQAEPAESAVAVGDIYVGKVRNIVKNIHAAFVEFQKGQMGYLSLDEKVIPIHTQGRVQDETRVLIGDEIIVQIAREAVKTKPPTLTGKIDLSGKYVALSLGSSGINVSRKITDKQEKMRLRELLEKYSTQEYGIIARTNSQGISEEALERELNVLMQRYQKVVAEGMHKAPFACLYQAPPAYLGSVRDMYRGKIHQVLTDSREIYEEIQAYVREQNWEQEIEVALWDEHNGRMSAVYNIDKTLERTLRQKVWLKSGGYLIIQPTEALVSIDVNTGKAISRKKDAQKTFYKINMEAAEEIACQLRLRNLSGIILVDFIDMKEEEANQELLSFLSRELAKDQIPAKLVDMTGLGLVEITRKKVRKPLYDQMKLSQTEEN